MIDVLTNKSPNPVGHLILTHGSMAPMDNPFMEAIVSELVARRLSVTRFEFAYMAQRRTGGKKRPPPRADKLLVEYLEVIEQIRASAPDDVPLTISGKSLGGRVASMIAQEQFEAGKISGLACLGYPFHPVGKPDNLRTAHLKSLSCPALILQGERDPFGTPEEIANFDLSPSIRFHWVGDGDHDFRPRARSSHTRAGNIADAAEAIAVFIVSLKMN
ncbi:MAG: alpha/beta family hydrolase [Hyphomicrobiaceae bacterium]